jgi:tRNA(Arg) A34 adenosine deaminase TadA
MTRPGEPQGSSASEAWDALDAPWQVALDEAWASWRTGSLGIGAVIANGAGTIVARGRNRIVDTRTEPGVLAATMIAHAEMNALAVLPVGPVDDLTLTTTLEPCLMCASTIVMVGIPRVRFAAPDPLFHGLETVLREHPYALARMPERDGPLAGAVGAFAQVLPLTVMSFWNAESDAVRHYRQTAPAHLALAEELNASQRLVAVGANGGTARDALMAIWPEVCAVAAATAGPSGP